jgi:Xaa-Pro aminopeptidase
LRADEPIVLDIFPRHGPSGYWGDMTRTVVKGTASREVVRMHRAVLDAQKRALAMIRPGVQGNSIHRAVQATLEDHGFTTGVEDGTPVGFFHGTGHGVGLDIHEAPRVSLSKDRLRAGHVITIEPGLYYPAHGGMRIEDTVVVTRDGYQRLASCTKRLHV